MEQNCRCSLLTRSPHAFTHDNTPCGWPDLAGRCPDCGEHGEACTFFSENIEENACLGLSRLVALAVRCQLDGAKRRLDAQLRQRVIVLSGGETSALAVSFATAHVKAYKDGLKLVEGVWLPQDISTKDTQFFWDRSAVPWRFTLSRTSASEPVTMRGLLNVLGIDGSGTEIDLQAPTPQPTLAALTAQVQELAAVVKALVRPTVSPGSASNDNNAAVGVSEAARQADEALRQAQLKPQSPTPWSPSQTFNLGSNNYSGNVINNVHNAELELAHLLAAAGASHEQIAQFLRARAPTTATLEHRYAWLQVTEGTSPLCVYTGLQGETRQTATPKTLRVETFDGQGTKLSLKVTAWPPAKPEIVPLFKFRELGDAWKRELVQTNLRIAQITPVADRGNAPSLPTDVDRFLEHCVSCLGSYGPVSVLRAWEAAHLFMVDEYINRRSAPSWDAIWMMPVFQAQLVKSAQGAGTASSTPVDVAECCSNWNLRQGRKCTKDPDPACTRQHVCMTCGGPHRILDHGQRE